MVMPYKNHELLDEVITVEGQLHILWAHLIQLKKSLQKRRKPPQQQTIDAAIDLSIQIGLAVARYLRDEIPIWEMLYRIEQHIIHYHNRFE